MKRKFNYDLLAILVLLLLMNIPLLSGRTQIFWDTYNLPYQEFSTIFSEVKFHGQLPLWLPFSSYGIPDYFSITALSIFNFLFIGIGKLFNVQNALLLFKLSLLGEQIIAITGMYLLARQLFKKKWVIWIVCLSTMVLFSVYRQVQLNFRLVYLLPLILFWIVLFFSRKSPEFLWIAGISMLFSIPGSAYYPLIIEFYAIAIFFITLLVFDFNTIRGLFKPRLSNLLVFCGLLLIAGAFFYYFKVSGAGVEIIRAGRRDDLSVPINDYLLRWKSWSPFELAISYFYGFISDVTTNNYEYIFYMGLLPLAGVIIACMYQRKPVFTATLIAGVFLYWFSLRGFFSAIFYYMPLVSATRYIAILGTIPFRIFLILAAGFGLDLDLSKNQLKKAGVVLVISVLVVDILGGLYNPFQPNSPNSYNAILLNAAAYPRDFKFFWFRVIGYLVFFSLFLLFQRFNKSFSIGRLSLPKPFEAGIVMLVLLDLFLFRFNYERKIQSFQPKPAPLTSSASRIHPLEYQSQRLMSPLNDEQEQLIQNSSPLQSVNPYLMESFVQFDRCVPYYVKNQKNKFEMFSSGLTPLMNAGLTLAPIEQATQGLKQIYGCEFPKIKVVSNVLVSDSNREALKAIKKTGDFSNLMILSREYSSLSSDLNNPLQDADIKISDFSANHLKLEVNLPQGKGGWLVYSDAYHPDWRATVNGKAVRIERAYLAFKAVHLYPGANLVELHYGSQLYQIAYLMIVILCGMAALVALIGVVFALFISDHAFQQQ